MPSFDNRTDDEIEVGETLSLSRKLTPIEIEALAFRRVRRIPSTSIARDSSRANGNGAEREISGSRGQDFDPALPPATRPRHHHRRAEPQIPGPIQRQG